MFNNKKVLVTGGTGMIGRELVSLLLSENAIVKVASLDNSHDISQDIEFQHIDLCNLDSCYKICENIDYIFHLAGLKGSPKAVIEKPSSFMVPMLQFNTNLLHAAKQANIKWLLYTSSMGVYSPAPIFYEDSVWDINDKGPSRNDWYGGWAKRMGEMQIEAYQKEGWNRSSIVRPANVYGRHDCFDSNKSMVIPSLIKKAYEATNIIEVFGDGSIIRDFIHAKDVARGMLFVVKNKITDPINLASGKGYTISELVNMIISIINPKLQIKWINGPTGDKCRLLDTTRMKKYNFKLEIDLETGLRDTIEWYRTNIK